MNVRSYKNHGLVTNRGFSLVELVTVMVLVAILSVFASQRFSGTTGFDEYIIRDQLISAIRFAQQRAMYDQASGRCYRVSVTPHSYSVDRAESSSGPYTAMSDFDFGSGDASVEEALDDVTLSAATLFFDGLGNPLDACDGAAVGNRSISIAGSATLPLCIYSTGYVSAAACP
jgi:MSHA pilin protein MshC